MNTSRTLSDIELELPHDAEKAETTNGFKKLLMRIGFIDDKSEIPEAELNKVVGPEQIDILLEKRKNQVWTASVIYVLYHSVILVVMQKKFEY